MTLAERVKKFAAMVAMTQENECDCGRVYELMDEAAELVTAGADLSAIMPEFVHHVQMCHCCLDEFEALQKILSTEAAA